MGADKPQSTIGLPSMSPRKGARLWYNISMRKITAFCFVFCGLFIVSGVTQAKVFLPNAVGSYSQWFAGGSTCTAGQSAGTFGEVDEYPVHDVDSTSNCTNLENGTQAYNLEDSSDSGTITNVRVIAVAKGVTTPEAIQLFVRGATDNFSTAQNLTTSYAAYTADWATNPFTSAAWTTSDITSLQAGFKAVVNGTWGGDIQRVTQLYVDVRFKTESVKAKFHVVQETGTGLASGVQIDRPFTITITDPFDDIQNAFIEIKGVVQENASATTIRVSIDDANPLQACNVSRVKCYTVNSTGRAMPVRLLYDVTDYFKEKIRTSGGYTFTLNIKNDGPATVNIGSGKLTMNYTWIIPPPAAGGGFRAKAEVTSSTFDTAVTNGAAPNTLLWKGTESAGRVGFQFASSACPNAETNPPTCTIAGSWSYLGPNGASDIPGDMYEPDPDFTIEIKAAHHNKRYFRYKVILCSNTNCLTAGGSATPQVNDVILNWAP